MTFLECDHCHRIFSRKYNLRTHIINCHIKSNCHCQICDEHFKNTSGLQQHLNLGHNRYNKAYPECHECGKVFIRKQNIILHIKTVHTEIRCKYCTICFRTSASLKNHIKQEHNPLNLPTCAYCFKRFDGKDFLATHIQLKHSAAVTNELKCNICNIQYSNLRNLNRHAHITHSVKQTFSCNLCPSVYTTQQSLKRHSKNRHSSFSTMDANVSSEYLVMHRPKLFKCNHCTIIFDVEYSLRQHIKSNHSFSDFYEYCRDYLIRKNKRSIKKTALYYHCEFCKQEFRNLTKLKNHMKFKHSQEYQYSTCRICFKKFYSYVFADEHKKTCIAPSNTHNCSHCDRLFTDISSLEFHTKIFHPTSQIPDTSQHDDELDTSCAVYRCVLCERVYYSDRSLKHHVKLKHSNDKAASCQFCEKTFTNKHYLATHIKMVHTNEAMSKCDHCSKCFKSKRNIRRHIEYTHLGIKRHKCIECETLFKEKRSLRKHVRTKHPNSTVFPQCHLCQKRFESAKSRKVHLKLVHSFNLTTHPCSLCSASFTSFESLNIHIQSNHSADDEIYKCQECNLVFIGMKNFETHKNEFHNVDVIVMQKHLPKCVLCTKDFSTRKTLKRHIKKFHVEFDMDELVNYGLLNKPLLINCLECIRKFQDDCLHSLYCKLKDLRESIVFTCDLCSRSYNVLEYSICRYKISNKGTEEPSIILSDLCTAEMSDDSLGEVNIRIEDIRSLKNEVMEPESTTQDSIDIVDVKIEID